MTEKKRGRFNILPSKKWQIPAIIVFGALIGLGIYTLKLSNAVSYLSDDPQACVNCHVMTPQYITWNKSSHREVASCNDCHVPHDNVFNQYYFKAKDGLYHASIFTMRAEPEVIQAQPASIEVIQDNCIRCHIDQVTHPRLSAFVKNHKENRTSRNCWECHNEVPHGKVKSLSSVGHQIEPLEFYKDTEETIIPEWLKKSLSENDSIEKEED
ncbi:cytochrome c nitrite reductase small subunit [Psychroflexus sp. S27]|uniref:cytochrome c nitrite reductase small subunit n=1 Tax=Psychroflexus sp. S27 TaxID=1982757 RepID=UPI000C29E664|nr:cytochrome c nitrite reductase small subunit [Psychroflexus sp. S27]PJX21745.1 cytochrome c nitrite reductase small subunit [Psychroflexus sp. S27]